MSETLHLHADGREGCLELIAAIGNLTDPPLDELELFIGDDIFVDDTLLEGLEGAIRSNASIYRMQIVADDANKIVPLLELLPLLAYLDRLQLDFVRLASSCSPAAPYLSRILEPSHSLASLSLSRTSFEGDFSGVWATLQGNTSLEEAAFFECTFDEANTESFELCFKTVKNEYLDLVLSKCRFKGKTSGRVAADILVASTLESVQFHVHSRHEGGDAGGFADMMSTLARHTEFRASLPSLALIFHDGHESVQTLRQFLSRIATLRHVSVRWGGDGGNTVELLDVLKQNGGLHSVEAVRRNCWTQVGQVFVKRNKRIPELLRMARGDEKNKATVAPVKSKKRKRSQQHKARVREDTVRQLVPTLFVAANQSPRLVSSTMMAALTSWERVGPSERAARANMESAVAAEFAKVAAAMSAIGKDMAEAVKHEESTAAVVIAATQQAVAQKSATAMAAATYAAELAKWKRLMDPCPETPTAEFATATVALASSMEALAVAAQALAAASADKATAVADADLASEAVVTKKTKLANAATGFAAAVASYSVE